VPNPPIMTQQPHHNYLADKSFTQYLIRQNCRIFYLSLIFLFIHTFPWTALQLLTPFEYLQGILLL